MHLDHKSLGAKAFPGSKHMWLRVKTNGIPFWGRCTIHFRTHFSGDWDVHWGYDLDFDPWPCGNNLKLLAQPAQLATTCKHGRAVSFQTQRVFFFGCPAATRKSRLVCCHLRKCLELALVHLDGVCMTLEDAFASRATCRRRGRSSVESSFFGFSEIKLSTLRVAKSCGQSAFGWVCGICCVLVCLEVWRLLA